jgi:hypothetical protein
MPPNRRRSGMGRTGVFIGSELGAVRFTRDGEFVDLGEAVVEGFAAVQPGLVELARLGSTDFAALTATERVDALVAVERQRAWLDGVQRQLLAEVVRRDDPKHYSREEVSAALGPSLQTAQSRMKDAEQLCSRLPVTLDALMSGSISCLLKREQTLSQLKQSIRRAVIRLDPASAEERRQRAKADRNIRFADAGAGHGPAGAAAAHRSRQGLLHPRRRHR